jgi:hypothetical protein
LAASYEKPNIFSFIQAQQAHSSLLSDKQACWVCFLKEAGDSPPEQ